MYEEVLAFWFKEIEPKMWWVAEPKFDELVCSRFKELLQWAIRGELYNWRVSPEGRLAEIIVLDQFSRNIHRNTPQAFSQDSMALVLAQEAVAADAHKPLAPIERGFLFLPYMHSESVQIHIQAETLYLEFAPPESYEFELRHKVIIDRFGRYPHRNQIIGRISTPEEIKFLKDTGVNF